MTYDLNKLCEKCGIKIPDDYQNLLCDDCYHKTAEETERLKRQEEEMKNIPEPIVEAVKTVEVKVCKNGISDINYKENPERPDKDQIMTNFAQFIKTGKLLWHPTRDMYEFIKTRAMEKALDHPQYPKYIWKPNIIDVGCGCGVGSNIMSQEADFVWGIDKNELSVNFAKEAFTRVKNEKYYSSQVSFDKIDIMDFTRETMKFDFIVAIEIIEHLADHNKFLETIIKKFDKRKEGYEATEYFISTPNRNNQHVNKEHPDNLYHVKEFTQEEFVSELSRYFKKVDIRNSKGEPVGDKNDHTPILSICSGIKI